uniref:Uncharacterized protein n=1 Tax=Xiphophorus couchianus TaxID=32473 RepID=A0A3B5MI11_9TELE
MNDCSICLAVIVFLTFFLLSVDFGRDFTRKNAKFLVNISKYVSLHKQVDVLSGDTVNVPACFSCLASWLAGELCELCVDLYDFTVHCNRILVFLLSKKINP